MCLLLPSSGWKNNKNSSVCHDLLTLSYAVFVSVLLTGTVQYLYTANRNNYLSNSGVNINYRRARLMDFSHSFFSHACTLRFTNVLSFLKTKFLFRFKPYYVYKLLCLLRGTQIVTVWWNTGLPTVIKKTEDVRMHHMKSNRP